MTKKKFTPSAAAWYKRIKPLFDKLQVDVVQQAEVIEELEVGRVLLKTKLDHRVKKCQLAGQRVAELLRLCRAQQQRIASLTRRNQGLAQKNLELAELADKYRGELESIRLRGVYAIITVGVLALGYGLWVIGR